MSRTGDVVIVAAAVVLLGSAFLPVHPVVSTGLTAALLALLAAYLVRSHAGASFEG